MTYIVTPRYKASDLKWYGKKGVHDLFQTPTGRIYEVIDQGKLDSTREVAFQQWRKDKFK